MSLLLKPPLLPHPLRASVFMLSADRVCAGEGHVPGLQGLAGAGCGSKDILAKRGVSWCGAL